MGQQWTTWIIVMSGLLILFYFNGMIANPPLLLRILLNPSGPDFLILAAQLGAAFLLASMVKGSINLGIIQINNSNAESLAIAGFMIVIANLVVGYIDVYNLIAAAAPVLAVLLFSPLILLLIFILFDFWRGTD